MARPRKNKIIFNISKEEKLSKEEQTLVLKNHSYSVEGLIQMMYRLIHEFDALPNSKRSSEKEAKTLKLFDLVKQLVYAQSHILTEKNHEMMGQLYRLVPKKNEQPVNPVNLQEFLRQTDPDYTETSEEEEIPSKKTVH